jgi:hypothetical protein
VENELAFGDSGANIVIVDMRTPKAKHPVLEPRD